MLSLTDETNIYKLLVVQLSVVVVGAREWLWNESSRGIDSLPDISPVDPPGYFFNQYGGQTFRSKLFVDA